MVTYVKISGSNNSIEKNFGCPACIKHYADITELRNHYYADHPETIEQHQKHQERQKH